MAVSPNPELTLSDLDCGVPAVVVDLRDDEGETSARLLELGVLPGVVVRVVRRSPFGCPVEVDVGGARYTMRTETTAAVRVRIEAP